MRMNIYFFLKRRNKVYKQKEEKIKRFTMKNFKIQFKKKIMPIFNTNATFPATLSLARILDELLFFSCVSHTFNFKFKISLEPEKKH
jgi:hypothetical protein